VTAVAAASIPQVSISDVAIMLAQLEMETRLALVPDGWDLADPLVRAAETQ